MEYQCKIVKCCPDETKAACLDYAKMEVPIPTFCGLLFGLKLVTLKSEKGPANYSVFMLQ